jgi:SulP family sulfate permease
VARTRYTAGDAPLPARALLAAALRAALREGYSAASFRADLLSGLVVGVVALPLAMALAIAVGVPPQAGLATAIVGGALIALLGGSRVQVSGPTAAFVVILAPVVTRFGLGGLLVAGALAGLMLLAMGLLRLGKLIEFIPYPVTTGFTAGIATVIAGLQLKDLFGLRPAASPEHFLQRMAAYAEAWPTASPWELGVGLLTLAVLVLWPRLSRAVPAPLVALPAAALLAALLPRLVPGAEVATIASRFQAVVDGVVVHGIPRLPPLLSFPWSQPGAGGAPLDLDFQAVRTLFPSAFAIAMLGAIESLLSAVVADGMARTRHDPDAELIAQGLGNLVVPFFGGIPATGAIARTATNIRSGGRTPVAAVVHALTVLLAVLVAAPLLGLLPMTSLAALLLLVAWNMSELKHVGHILRVAPRADMVVLLTCFALTVAFDMVVGVSVGMVLAAFLFMRRMAEVTEARALTGTQPDLPGPIPPGVVVYDIAGALFFGAASKAMATMHVVAHKAHGVVLRLDGVQAMDATGLVALESAVATLTRHKCRAIITGLRPQPRALVERAGLALRPGVAVCDDVAEGLRLAAEGGPLPTPLAMAAATPPPGSHHPEPTRRIR